MRLKQLLLLLLLAVAFVPVFSQTFNLDWATALGGGKGRILSTTAFVRGDNGDLFAAGRFEGGFDLDDGPDSLMLTSGLGQANFLVAYDASGGIRWAQRMPGGGTIRGLAAAADGSIFAVGEVYARDDWNPGPGVTTIGPGSNVVNYSHGFLLRFSAAGEFLWIHSFGDQDHVRLNDVVVTSGGSVYVTGDFEGRIDFDPSNNVVELTESGPGDALLARFGLDGHLVWAKAIGSATHTYELGQKISLDGQGHILLAGLSDEDTDFDPNSGVFSLGASTNSLLGFVAKYDYAGQLMWANRISTPSPTGTYPMDVIADGQGGAWICNGLVNGDIVVDAYSGQTLSGTGEGGYLLHYDATGRYQSGIRIGTIAGFGMVEPRALAVDGNGGIWVTGECSSGTDFDPGPAVSQSYISGLRDAFLAHYTAAGTLARVINWGNYENESPIGLASLPGGGCVVASDYMGEVDFDPGAATALVRSGGFGRHYAISQYDNLSNFVHVTSPLPLSGGDDQVHDVVLDGAGNTYLLATYTGVVDLDPGPGSALAGVANTPQMSLCKFDPNNQLLWTIAFQACELTDARALMLDDAGNVYVQVNLTGTNDFDPSSNYVLLNPMALWPGMTNVVAKYTDDGQYVWAHIAQSGTIVVREFEVDGQGNSYLLCDFAAAVDVDPSTNVSLVHPDPGQSHALLQKLDANGNLAWAHRFAADSSYVLDHFCLNPLGGVYLGGPILGGGDIDPAPGSSLLLPDSSSYVFLHLRDDGSLDWATPHNNSGFNYMMEVDDIDADTAGHFMVVGRASQGWDFDPSSNRYLLYNPSTVYPGYPYLACYDSLGQFVYANRIGENYGSDFKVLDVRPDGLTLVGGTFVGSLRFDSTGLDNLYSPNQFTPVATVYAADGQWLTAAQFPCKGGRAERVTVHAAHDGSLFVGGAYTGWIDLDPLAGPVVYASRGLEDGFCGRYHLCTSPSVSYTELNTPLCFGPNTIALSPGLPAGGLYHGPGVSGTAFTPALAGVGDIPVTYVVTDSSGCVGAASSVITVQVCTEAPAPVSSSPILRVFPNPSNGRLQIETDGLPGRLTLTLHNSLGQPVHSGLLPTDGTALELTHLPAGVYVVRVAGAGKAAVTRWVKVD